MSPAIVLTLACLGPVVTSSSVPVSSDIYAFFFQVGAQLKHAYTTGELPFWNGTVLSGTPLLADPATALFYLPNVLLYGLLPVGEAIRASILLHLLVAYFATYAFLRSACLGRSAALYGAVSYAFSGYVLFRVLLLPLLMIAALLPVLFCLTHQVLQTKSLIRRLVYAIGLALCIALDILVGFPQGTYYTLLAVVAYALSLSFDWGVLTQAGATLGRVRRIVVWIGLPLLAAIGLCAVQLLPTLEFVGVTDHAAGYPVGETVMGLTASSVWSFLGAGPFGEQRSYYTGALGLALAPVALLLHRNRQTLFFSSTAVLALALMTRYRNPVRSLATLVLPGWSHFEDHVPTRALVYVTFCLAALGAWALQRPLATMRWLPLFLAAEAWVVLLLINTPRWQPDPALAPTVHSQLHLVAVFAIANLLVLMAWRIPQLKWRARQLAVPSLLVLLVLDLGVHNRQLGIAFHSLAEVFRPSPAADFLAADIDAPSRFVSVSTASTWDLGYLDTTKASTILAANAAGVYGLREAQGYNPLQISRYKEFLRAVNGPGVNIDYHLGLVRNPVSPLLRYLSVKYLVTDPSVPVMIQLTGATELNPSRTTLTVPISVRGWRAIAIDSYLGSSISVPQGTPVGAVDLVSENGTSTRVVLRAGVDTAEWSYDRADVRQVIQHSRPASVGRTWQAGGGFQGHAYRATLNLPEQSAITGLRLELLAPGISWTIDRVTSGPDLLHASHRLVFEASGVRILQSDESLPHAFLVHSVEQVEGDSAILARLEDPHFDPRRSVVLEEPPSVADSNLGAPLTSNGAWARAAPAGDAFEAVEVLEDDSSRKRLRVRAERPAILVVSDNFYPAWRAYVDGSQRHVYRANYVFRGVAVPAGEHEVEFRYESASFHLGLLISCATLIASLVGVGCVCVRDRRQRSVQR